MRHRRPNVSDHPTRPQPDIPTRSAFIGRLSFLLAFFVFVDFFYFCGLFLFLWAFFVSVGFFRFCGLFLFLWTFFVTLDFFRCEVGLKGVVGAAFSLA